MLPEGKTSTSHTQFKNIWIGSFQEMASTKDFKYRNVPHSFKFVIICMCYFSRDLGKLVASIDKTHHLQILANTNLCSKVVVFQVKKGRYKSFSLTVILTPSQS